MQVDRLLKLVAHLKAGRPGGHAQFDFGSWHVGVPADGHCGTLGCALGECPVVFPEDWDFTDGQPCYKGEAFHVHAAERFFEIPYWDAYAMFLPEEPRWWASGQELSEEAAALEVAESIEQYVAAVRARNLRR